MSRDDIHEMHCLKCGKNYYDSHHCTSAPPAPSIERLREISENCKYFQYVVPDYMEGRRNGLTDEETEELANKTLSDLQNAFDALIKAKIQRRCE